MKNVRSTIHCRVGRLIEARLITLGDADEASRLEEAMGVAIAKARRKGVICSDFRATALLSPTVADLIVGAFQRANPYIERSAILLPAKNASFNLQVERIVREAKNDARRTFRVARDMEEWLRETLDEPERERVRAFLSGSE